MYVYTDVCWIMENLQWTMPLKKTNSSSPISHQLTVCYQKTAGLSIYAGILIGLVLCRQPRLL